jgi:hypothetical protein
MSGMGLLVVAPNAGRHGRRGYFSSHQYGPPD